MKARAAALALALAACPAIPSGAQDAPAVEQQEAIAERREILVMLRMPAPHLRPNARYGGRYDDRAALAARERAAAEIARENGLELVEGWPMPLIGVDCYVMRVPEGVAIESAIEQVSRRRIVAWSQPVHDYEALASSRGEADPLFAAQPAATKWRLADLHGIATGKGVTIAVIDSKVEVSHPDLSGQFVANRDYFSDRRSAPEEHGTGIAGVIGAKPGNGIGIVGIAPGARLMALRACYERRRGERSASTCDTLSLAKALHHALEHGADVINMSLSGPPDLLLGSLIEVGLDRNVAVVAAFDARYPAGGFPASMDGVIPVAEESLRLASGQVYRAPGRDIPTTQPGGRWFLVNGSSYAAAHVSGLLALAREERGAGFRSAGLARSDDGVIDACATLLGVSRDCDCSCAITRAAGRSN